jgi:hypothetical protein
MQLIIIYIADKKITCISEANLVIVQKGAYYLGIKIFNGLLTQIKELSVDHKKFKIALKHAFFLHSFYTLVEYFNRLYVIDK